MLETVISGGQTGADQAGWRAAERFLISTGGWMPKGFKTEDGPRPEFECRYHAKEHRSPDYQARTAANVYDADGTVIFTNNARSPGTLLVGKLSSMHRRPLITVMPRGVWRSPRSLIHFINQHKIKTLNVAGNRESSFPGCGHWTELYLTYVFRRLGFIEQVPMEPRTRVTPVCLRYTPKVATVNRLQSPIPEPMVRPAAPRFSFAADLWDARPKATYSHRKKNGKPIPTKPYQGRNGLGSADPSIKPPWIE